MESNNEPSSSDDDDCRLVLGPQFGRKLKRPVNPQTESDAIKKPKNDFNDIVSFFEGNNEFEPKAPQFDAVFEISELNELLDIEPLSESWSSTRLNEDEEESTCTVEDCRHNKLSNDEENNNTTTEYAVNTVNELKTVVHDEASTSETNVLEPSTEFKVPNPVGATKQNTSKKKESNSTVSSTSFHSDESNALNSNKFSTSNYTKKSESASSAKTTSANSIRESENLIPLNNADQTKNNTSRNSEKQNASQNSDKSNESSEFNKTSPTTNSSIDLIMITNDEVEAESNIDQISTVMLTNAVVEAEIKAMNERLNKSVIGFVKLFTKNAEDIDILGENDDTFTASGRFEVENKLKNRQYPDGSTKLELHITILTTIFSTASSRSTSKNAHNENEDQKINEAAGNDTNQDSKKFNKYQQKNSNKRNNKSAKNGRKNKKKNKKRKTRKELKHQQKNEQQNVNNGRKNYVDPNQPSTSRNYDPRCVLAVPSTSKCNNLLLNQKTGSSEVRQNRMDVDSSNGTETPALEPTNLTVDDLAVPGCSDEFVKAEQKEAFRQIKSEVGVWIKQCIDNIPITKPAQEKDIMHNKVLQALLKKLRLLYNNCYDILRNKKIQIIVPVSEDPNSDSFKPIISLTENNRIQHIMLDGSDTKSEESVIEEDLAVLSDTDIDDTEQFADDDAQDATNDSDEDSFSSQSLNCDIVSALQNNESIKNSTTSQNTLHDTQDTTKIQDENKKEQNENININEVMDEDIKSKNESNNEDLICLQSDEEQEYCRNVNIKSPNDSKLNIFDDAISLIDYENSIKNDGEQEDYGSEADVDDLNSSVNEEEEDEIPNPANTDDEEDILTDDECQNQRSFHNNENNQNGTLSKNEIGKKFDIAANNKKNNESEDDSEDDQDNSGEKNTTPMEMLINQSQENHQTVSEQSANVDANFDRLLQENIPYITLRPLQPSQVIHSQHDNVSNILNISMHADYEKFCGRMNAQPNFYTKLINTRDQSSTDNETTDNGHESRSICNVIRFAPSEEGHLISATSHELENESQLPTTEIQSGQSENGTQISSLNASSFPTNTSSIFNRLPCIATTSRIPQSPPPWDYSNPIGNTSIANTTQQVNQLPLLPNPVVCNQNSSVIQSTYNPQVLNHPSLNNLSISTSSQQSNPIIENIFSTRQEPEKITVSTQTSPIQLNTNRNTESQQQLNTQTTETNPNLEIDNGVAEWTLSDTESSDSSTSVSNETVSRVESPHPVRGVVDDLVSFLSSRQRLLRQVDTLRLENSTMRDSHRNLWLRQQHQLETMRRHAVRSPIDRPVTLGTFHASRSEEIATSAPTNAANISNPIPSTAQSSLQISGSGSVYSSEMLLPLSNSQHPESVDLRQHTRLNRYRAYFQLFDQAHNSSSLRRVVDIHNRPSAAQQQHEHLQRNLYQSIEIDDDDDNNDVAGANLHSLNMQRLYENLHQTESLRTSRILGILRRFFNEHNFGEEDFEDPEYHANHSIPLQQLVDNTTVLFQYDGSTQEERCNICLSDYVRDDILRRLPCFHTYHRACIDQWLSRERRTCPNCRMYLSSHLCYNTNTNN